MTILLKTIAYYHISVNIFSDKDIILNATCYIPTETRENSLSTEADLNFVIPKRKMYYTFEKGENMKWPLVTDIFGYVGACISITDHNRQVKVIYCLDPIMHQV